MDKEDYINQIMTEHLSTNDYLRLTKQEALSKLLQLKDTIKNLISNDQDSLSQPELIYFQRGLKNQHRLI
jgi:hypothetical protein